MLGDDKYTIHLHMIHKKINWTSTELFSLPEDAGMRQFLLVRKKGTVAKSGGWD